MMNDEKQSPETTTDKAKVDFGKLGVTGWDEVAKPRVFKGGAKNNSADGKKRLSYLKFAEGTSYKIRLIGFPKKHLQHYRPIMATSPGFEDDACWQAGNTPSERYTIHILDREDGNQLKLLEGGPLLFGKFKSYFTLTKGKEPGANEAPDFIIQKEIPETIKDGRKVKNQRDTKYHVMRDEITPLTDEELKYIKENSVELETLKKPHAPEMIVEMMKDAQTRGPDDPVPGSSDWWKARSSKRRENAQAGNSGATDDSGGTGPTLPASGSEEPEANRSFDDLFPKEEESDSDGQDESKQF